MRRSFLISIAFAMLMTSRGKAQEVDPLTGRAVVNIPLGGINALDLGVSVNLSHHGGALKVAEGPGNAGAGFSVSFGHGYVAREVRGLPDDYNGTGGDGRKGWLFNNNAQNIQNFTPSADDNLGVCTDESADWNFINNLFYTSDSEGDLYYFFAPGGLSGKFVFGADGQPKLIPYQDLQITYSDTTFTIKTNNGLVYKFNIPERVERQAFQYDASVPVNYFKSNYNYYQTPLSYIATWNLSSVESKTSGATINYTYEDGEQGIGARYITAIQPTDSLKGDTLYYFKETFYPKLLNRVSLKNYAIDIHWANSLVDNIVISEQESGESKQFDFVYRFVQSTYDVATVKVRNLFVSKPFLMEVKQRPTNVCDPLPSYKFEYVDLDTVNYTIPIAWHTGWGQDYFGYNNDQTSNKNIPRIYFYASESGARRYRITPIPNTSAQVYRGIGKGGRDVNFSKAQIGAIRAVHLPSGGVTRYTYEAIKYKDSSTGQVLYGPGIRVAKVQTSGGDYASGRVAPADVSSWHTVTKTYQYSTSATDTTSSGKILYPPVFAFTDGSFTYRSHEDLGPGSQVLYSRVKEIMPGLGSRVYHFDLPNTYPDATATTSKVARQAGAPCSAGLLKNGSYTFPFAPLTDLDFKRGFLTKLSEYNEAGTLTMEKRMTYITPQTNTVIKGLKFEPIMSQSNTHFHYSVYQIPVNQSRILSQEVVKQISDVTSDSTKVTTVYTYNTKNLLTRSTTTNDDNSILTKDIKYSGDYVITAPKNSNVQAKGIYRLNNTNRSAEVIESYATFTPVGGAAKVIGAGITIFKDDGTLAYPYQMKHLKPDPTATFTASSVSGTPQAFVYDSADYILDGTVEYQNGLPVNQIGISLIQGGTHYSVNTGLPLATFINCKAENAIYDGFELVNSRGLTGDAAIAGGWTGQKAGQLGASLLVSAPTTKSENTYRISLWAYSTSSNVNILVQAKNGTTIQSSLTLNYPTANQWTYLEGYIDMTGVSASFMLQLSSASQIKIDDFVAMPRSARVSHKTYQPLTGVTSQTDDRGNSTALVYDQYGRLINTLDRKRNLVTLTEYSVQTPGKLSLDPTFTTSATQYLRGSSVTFTAAPTCVPNVSYTWTFTDSQGNQTTATGSPLVKTFTGFGAHSVKLTASSPGYGSATYLGKTCVGLPENLNVSVGVSPNNVYHRCNSEEAWKTFTASLNGYSGGPGITITYQWSITDANGDYTSSLPPGTTVNGNQVTLLSPYYNYSVKCAVIIEGNSGNGNESCNIQTIEGSGEVSITYIHETQCP